MEESAGQNNPKPSRLPFTLQPETNSYLTFMLVMLVGQLSPGPDFLLVVRNSLQHGLRGGLFTVAGISTGIIVHATVAATGLALVLAVSPRAYRALLFVGALYLGWLGIKLLLSLRKKPPSDAPDAAPSDGTAFREGLFTNLLNPKVAIFFSSILAQFLRPDSPPHERVLYPAIIVVEGALVWCLVAFLLQKAPVRRRFLRFERPLNALFGVLLLAVALATFLRS